MNRRRMVSVMLVLLGGMAVPALGGAQTCSASYPDFCIPPPPPDLDCGSPAIAGRNNFTALPPDPHGLDGLDGNDDDGLACEDPSKPRFTTTTVTVVATTIATATTTTVVSPSPVVVVSQPPVNVGPVNVGIVIADVRTGAVASQSQQPLARTGSGRASPCRRRAPAGRRPS